MNKLFHAVAGLVAATFLLAGGALAAGSFSTFPVVGGAEQCAGYSTGANGQPTCTSTIPAGPTGLTGSEMIPADTGLTQGQSPQTVRIPVRVLGGGMLQYAEPSTGNTVVVAATTGKLLLKPSGTLATLTVTLPGAAAAQDGQLVSVSSTQTITALTLNAGSGATVSNTPTALTPSATGAYGYQFVFRKADSTWYRLQ